MGHGLEHLRLGAVNIDGVMLGDTFSPVIHRFLTSRGRAYTVELERNIFSQPRAVAGRLLAESVGGTMTGEQALEAYFEERARYVAEHPVRVTEGALELVARLRRAGLRTVCYGGLAKDHFDRFLGEHAALFDGPGYICTDAVRPGLHEIATEHFDLKYDEVLVVDDVARVAEEARRLGMPFIGHPSHFEHSFQRQLMREAGVRHLVDSLHAVDEELLRTVDAQAAAGTVWSA
ncbi:haloacid dehalogenase-like hydrolase [Streptomyces populi]|uniref:Haloacid dehalogenase-like hydrolase n=1 Tax=Streptomyces populi TaxID=2058924 RepID=A0A2I0SC29_9ACTN|nr:haloacid dehalogenase-like hydrolase [Streptomyces populi]PKT67453.1 haloacid dehalogenase-like hydrolase [Streptomyces populi]